MNEHCAILLLPRLKVQNANAISGPFTWGFPAPTAFLGFVHALERRFSGRLAEGFGGVGIICHRFDPQVFLPPGRRTRVFRLTRNPITKEGKPSAFVEEGRAHMEISLVIAVNDFISQRNGEYLAEDVMEAIQTMRLAGGSIFPGRPDKRHAAQWWPLTEDAEGQRDMFRKFRRRLLPGFALVHREDRLMEILTEMRQTQPEASTLDVLLDVSGLNYEPNMPHPEGPEENRWGIRKKPGWLVPLPIGYAGLSRLYEPGIVKGARDPNTPFRFVECIYSLGEWISPHRLSHFNQLFWHYHHDPETGIYRCINHFSEELNPA